MDHNTPREECVYQPAPLRSAYVALSVFVMIGMLAVTVGLIGPTVSEALDPHMINASADQFVMAALKTA